MTKPNEISLEKAAKLAKLNERFTFTGTEQEQRRQREQAEGTAVLETMLAAGRKGKDSAMTPLDAAKALAVIDFQARAAYGDSDTFWCPWCQKPIYDPESFEGAPFPLHEQHAPDCPWLQLPKIVAALERLEAIERTRGTFWFTDGVPTALDGTHEFTAADYHGPIAPDDD